MIDRDIDLKRLKLAKVRYYDAKNNGAELSDIDAVFCGKITVMLAP